MTGIVSGGPSLLDCLTQSEQREQSEQLEQLEQSEQSEQSEQLEQLEQFRSESSAFRAASALPKYSTEHLLPFLSVSQVVELTSMSSPIRAPGALAFL